MFLTADELHHLTGYQRPHMQRRWLEKRGWPFEENAAGAPVVLRAVAEQKLGLAVAAPSKRRPNFGAMA